MKNTPHVGEWLRKNIPKHGTTAEYSRFLDISHPTLSDLINGKTGDLRTETINKICAAERITEDDLYAISKGRDPHEQASDAGSHISDVPARLAEFMRTLPQEKQDIIYATAGALGFKSKGVSSSSDAGKSKSRVA